MTPKERDERDVQRLNDNFENVCGRLDPSKDAFSLSGWIPRDRNAEPHIYMIRAFDKSKNQVSFVAFEGSLSGNYNNFLREIVFSKQEFLKNYESIGMIRIGKKVNK